MSYILDALKKSDSKRRQNEVPDLQTMHMPELEEAASNKWLYMIIVLLLVILAFLIGVYQPWNHLQEKQPLSQKPPLENTPVPTSEEKAAVESVEAEAVQAPERSVESVSTKREVTQAESVEPGDKPLSHSPIDELEMSQDQIRQIPRLSELPDMIQQAIPNMVYAGHVYSSSAVQRSIIINGYAMSEGDTVIDGLKVKQITADGVIFDYQGQLFRVEILQDWSFD